MTFYHANTDLHGKKSSGLSVFAWSAFHNNISYNTAQSSIVVGKIAQIFQSLPTPRSFHGPCWLCQYTLRATSSSAACTLVRCSDILFFDIGSQKKGCSYICWDVGMTDFVLTELVYLQLVRRHYMYLCWLVSRGVLQTSHLGAQAPSLPLPFPSRHLHLRLTVFPVVFPFLHFPSVPSHSLKRRPPFCA